MAGEIKTTQLAARYTNFFGGGTDGSLATGGGTTSLTRDTYYNNVDLTTAGDILRTEGCKLFVKGTLTVGAAAGYVEPCDPTALDGVGGAAGGAGGAHAYTSTAPTLAAAVSGSNGGAGAVGGGAAGTAGTAATGMGGSTPIAGAGGAGNPGAGGAAGALANRVLSPAYRLALELLRDAAGNGTQAGCGAPGGGGGGGDGANAGGTGGGGGAGGAPLVIFARNVVNDNVIRSPGGAGGNGQNGAGGDSGGGGGGSGGGGGFVYLVCETYTQGIGGSVTAAGGVKGTGGAKTGAGVNGGDGGNGNAGTVVIVNLGSDTVTVS